MAFGRENAETIALQALGWLAGQDELWTAFLGASGLDPAEVRAQAADADFLGSVLDFILTDDGWVVRFCDEAGIGYDRPLAARQALPGGAVAHWT